MNLRNTYLTLVLVCFLNAIPSFSSESLGCFDGKIDEKPVHLDAIIWAYAPSEKGFLVEVAFPKEAPLVDNDSMADLNWFHMGPFTPDLFTKVFDSNTPIENLFLTDRVYDSHVRASSEGKFRTITVNFQGHTDSYVPEAWRRGQIVIKLEHGKKLSLSMKREYKINGNWVKLFDVEALDLVKNKSGVALLDNGEMGRLAKPELILKACADTFPVNLKKLLDLEKQ